MKDLRIAGSCFHILLLILLWSPAFQKSGQEKVYDNGSEVAKAHSLTIINETEFQGGTSLKLLKLPLNCIPLPDQSFLFNLTFPICKLQFLQFEIVNPFFVTLSAQAP